MHVQPKSSTEKIVYFVRHGESEDNASPVFQATDSPLSDRGQQQAAFIAKRVENLKFEALIASPLERAKQTAQAISKATGKTVSYSELFVERIKPASISGKPYTDKPANKIWREWEASLVTNSPQVEDGENFEAIVNRADKALAYLYDRPEKIMLVITHGYIFRTIVARVLLGDTLKPESFKHFQHVIGMENTGLSVLVYEGAFEQKPCWKLWIHNDHAHLAE